MQRNTPSLYRWVCGFGGLLSICLTFLSLPALAAQPGDAGLFDTWAGYSIGRNPVAATTADFNGDGAPDVAWARHDFFHGQIAGNTMTVQLNLGEGTLGAPVDWPSVDNSTDIGSADLDGDGDADIVVISEGNTLNATIDIYLSNGNGTFTHSTATGGEAPQRLALADFDGDGDIDLAMTDAFASYGVVSVLLNNGDATFGTEQRISAGNATIGIAAADLDGDGDRDLAVGGIGPLFNTSEITLLANDGAGSFTVAGSVLAPTTEYIGAPLVVAGDLDGDGDADLVAAGGNSQTHVVLLNQGSLTFTQVSYIGGFGPGNLTLADHDGDGDLDLYSASQGSGTGGISYFANQGGGTFGAATIIESSDQPQDVAAADFNRDGRPDIAVPNRGTGTGVIHPQGVAAAFEAPPTYPTFNAPDSVVTADFDGDGDVDVASSVPLSKVIDVKFNDGAGALTSGSTIPATPTPDQGQPASVWAADLNGDSRPDLVWTASSFPPKFGVALNQGGGLFRAPVFTAPAGCVLDRVTTADVDNDGDQDVIAGNGQAVCPGASSSVLSISLNDGTGTFAPGTFVDMTIFLPIMGRGADVNGDGLTDLVGITTVPLPIIGDVAVVLGTGNGAFAPATAYVTGRSHREFELADFDNDGDVDAATSDGSNVDSVSVLLNDGIGNLGTPTNYPGESIPGLANQGAIDAGDVNGDGNVDIVVANRVGQDIGVYFGHGDGTFDGEQMRYGMHADLADVELADMNGDGSLDAVGPTNPTGTPVAVATATPFSITSILARIVGVSTAFAATDSASGVSVLLNGSTPGGAFTLSVGKTGSGHGQVTSPAGIDCGATCSHFFAPGTLVTLTATPTNDSTFTGWSGACTGAAATCTVSMTGAKSATATFTASAYTLTITKTGSGNGRVTSTPVGIDCGTTCSSSYAAGTLVTLTATPTNASTFTGWSGACTGAAATCTVSMTGAKLATATFTVNRHTLTVTKAGNGSGLVTSTPPGINCGATCSSSYAAGTKVTLRAIATKNSTFASWSGVCTGAAATCKVSMTATKSVTAKFTKKRE